MVHARTAAPVHAAVRRTPAELETPASGLLGRLKRLKGLDLGAGGFRFGSPLDDVGARGGTTLARALTELIDRTRTDVVLIADEVRQALAGDAGTQMLLAIEAARDAVRPRPGTPGHFLFIGTGSHRAQGVGTTPQGRHAFAADALVAYAAVVRREVTVDQVQRIAEELRDANPILRRGHGVCAVTAPMSRRPGARGRHCRRCPGGSAPAGRTSGRTRDAHGVAASSRRSCA